MMTVQGRIAIQQENLHKVIYDIQQIAFTVDNMYAR